MAVCCVEECCAASDDCENGLELEDLLHPRVGSCLCDDNNNDEAVTTEEQTCTKYEPNTYDEQPKARSFRSKQEVLGLVSIVCRSG